jgi:hypothetical protein
LLAVGSSSIRCRFGRDRLIHTVPRGRDKFDPAGRRPAATGRRPFRLVFSAMACKERNRDFEVEARSAPVAIDFLPAQQ